MQQSATTSAKDWMTILSLFCMFSALFLISLLVAPLLSFPYQYCILVLLCYDITCILVLTFRIREGGTRSFTEKAHGFFLNMVVKTLLIFDVSNLTLKGIPLYISVFCGWLIRPCRNF